MKEKEIPKPEYQKGFNEGYTITQHMPDLAEQLAKAVGESERDLGFQDGRKQLLLEQGRAKYPVWLRGDRISRDSTGISKTETKDKDTDIEPEL